MSKLDYINIDIGTDSVRRMSNGNTLPLIALPHSMHGVTLESQVNSERIENWFYSPHAKFIEGIRISHQPSPWIMDYGHFSFLPFTKDIYLSRDQRCTSIKKEVFKPDELSLYLPRYQIQLDLVPTKNGFKSIVSSKGEDEVKILFDLGNSQSSYEYGDDWLSFTVTNMENYSNPLYKKMRKHFYFRFDKKIKKVLSFINDIENDEQEGENQKLVISFDSQDVTVGMAASFITKDQAVVTYDAQISGKSYDQLHNAAISAWEQHLNVIEVEASVAEKNVFYSNLYRTLLFPHDLTEIDKSGNEVYFDFNNMEKKSGQMIADNGFWDTYKTTMPLLSLFYPKFYKKIIKSILNTYRNSGWLPRWMAPFEVGCMPSTLVDSVVIEALLKGFVDKEDKQMLCEAVLKNAEVTSRNELYGREHLIEYIEKGYIPYNNSIHSVSTTLDYCYTDYCVSKMMNYFKNDSSEYEIRAKNYKKLFNPENMFFVAKDNKGKFRDNFSPFDWGRDYCESSAWQNNFSVIHDLKGLEELFGGKAQMLTRLDTIFDQDSNYNLGRYDLQIHEQLEMGVLDLGQFAISNQPSFHLPYIYFYLQEYKQMMMRLKDTFKVFTDKADGFPGDEDNGSLSSWYILSSIGLYPLKPVDKEYLYFPSKFKRVELKIGDKYLEKSDKDGFKTVNFEQLKEDM